MAQKKNEVSHFLTKVLIQQKKIKNMELSFRNIIFIFLKQNVKNRFFIFSIFLESFLINDCYKVLKKENRANFYKKKIISFFFYSKFFTKIYQNKNLIKRKINKEKKKKDDFKILIQKLLVGFFFQIPLTLSKNTDYYFLFLSFMLSLFRLPICSFRFVGCVMLKKFNENFFLQIATKSRTTEKIFCAYDKVFSFFIYKSYKDMVEEVRTLAFLYFFFTVSRNTLKGTPLDYKISKKIIPFSRKEQIIGIKKVISTHKNSQRINKDNKKKILISSNILDYDVIIKSFLYCPKKKENFPYSNSRKWIYTQINLFGMARWFFVQNISLQFIDLKQKIIVMISSYFRNEVINLLDLKLKFFFKNFMNQKNLILLAKSLNYRTVQNSHLYTFAQAHSEKKEAIDRNQYLFKSLIPNESFFYEDIINKKYDADFLSKKPVKFYSSRRRKYEKTYFYFFFPEKNKLLSILCFLGPEINFPLFLTKKERKFPLKFFLENILILKKIFTDIKKKKIGKPFFIEDFRTKIRKKDSLQNQIIPVLGKFIFVLKTIFIQKKISFFHFIIFKKNFKFIITKKKIFEFEVYTIVNFLFTTLISFITIWTKTQEKIYFFNIKNRVKFLKTQNFDIISSLLWVFFLKTQKINIKFNLLSILIKICGKFIGWNLREKKNEPFLKSLNVWNCYYFKTILVCFRASRREDHSDLQSNNDLEKIQKKQFMQFTIKMSNKRKFFPEEKENFKSCLFEKGFYYISLFLFYPELSKLLLKLNRLFNRGVLFTEKFIFYINLETNGFIKKKNNHMNLITYQLKNFFINNLTFIEEKKNDGTNKINLFDGRIGACALLKYFKKNCPKNTSLTTIFDIHFLIEILLNKLISSRKKLEKKIKLKNLLKRP